MQDGMIANSEAVAANIEMVSSEVIYEILNKLEYTALIIAGNGDIIFANTPFLALYGLTQEQVDGRKIYDMLLGITTKERCLRAFEKARANGGTLKYEREMTRNGKPRYSETTIIVYGMAGQERILYLSKDITELRLSQVQATELNQMLNKIIDNLPVYLFVKDVDDDLRYLIWNKAFAHYSKIPAENVIGKTDFEVFPDVRDAQNFRNDDLKVIERGEMLTKHETYVAADGNTHAVQTYKTLVHRKNRGPLLVGISLDVTSLEGIEEELVQERLRAEESDRLKSRFLANMSHEIRTPLNVIVGFAGMMADADDEETRLEFTHIISQNSELLLQLINDILDLSKIEAGTLEYNRLPMDLYETCHNIFLMYKDKMPEGVQLVFDNDDTPCTFMINEDRNRIMQVIDNLINNASKFTTEGEIRYGFGVKDDWIEVYVSDTGRGIPKERQKDVFERFVKLDSFAQGTGLGLSICKLIVETMGGKMTLLSEEGRGSTFRFTIPYKKDCKSNNAEQLEKKGTVMSKGDKNSLIVLVAEDVNSNFLVVKTMIKGRYNLLWAKNGTEAVQIAREKKPDLILMDIRMPDMNGLDATREIRLFDKNVPIVALTANAYDEDRMAALHAGMNNFLPKPLNRDAFEAILLSYLG